MQKNITVIIIIVCFLAVSSCFDQTKKTADPVKLLSEKASWLVGTWKNNIYSESIVEVWERENDTLLVGKSYRIKVRDTTLIETIRLVARGKDLLYIPTVCGQNDGKPVSFKLTAAYMNELVFENPEHDFPQKIVYKQTSLYTLVAEVSGITDGQLHKEVFTMTRSKEHF